MRALIAFFKKELLESLRSGKLMLLAVIFCAVGIMNPAIAKLTPWLFEMLSEELAESGMIVGATEVDALTSWTQFFKNIPIAFIAFIFIYGSVFTKEYDSGTLVLILTKGLARYKVVLAKYVVMLLVWSAGYWLCFGITYLYNDFYWDNSIATGLMPAVLNWWLFGVFVVSLVVLFSVLMSTYGNVLLCTGGAIFASYMLGLLPKAAKYLPTSLMSSSALLIGAEEADKYVFAIIISILLSVASVALSIPILNKKQI
ncbi:MAG: ABC transporter permease [Ruminococcaceae bacterium]|nr:ABC transporter permease [Oscillospiraceae bacterium]